MAGRELSGGSARIPSGGSVAHHLTVDDLLAAVFVFMAGVAVGAVLLLVAITEPIK